MYRKVMLGGERLWVPVDGGAEYPVSPAHHVKADGSDLDFAMCFDDATYAHVYDGEIVRFGEVVGRDTDFVAGWSNG